MADRGDFATLLRAWRDRLQPGAVGLPAGAGRRAAGIRREELSVLAGISVDYIVRLEQGRADRPSEQVVAAIARALQLSPDERDTFYAAAGLAAPLPSAMPTLVPASVQRLLTRLPDVGVAVFAPDWTILSANATWQSLHGAWEGRPRSRNLFWRHFVTDDTRLWRAGEATLRFERALIADLRVATIRYSGDPGLQALIADLVAASDRFRDLWDAVEVGVHQSERKTIVHPSVGHITLDCDVLQLAGTDLHIVTFTAEPGSEDASRLDLARTLGVAASVG